MKIVGLITEYNPFHNGHKYHIEKAKEITGADYCIAVMSGDFVQRGAPAFLPKHLRAAMALDGGCDMVLELPVRYATGSAEYFAAGAISILDSLGCVDAVCFGSECGDYDSLKSIANVLVNEPSAYKDLLHSYLKQGLNFPMARQKALKQYLCDDELNMILEHPNNILGIEYIKALLTRNSSIKGYTIKRKGASYHNNMLSEYNSSASAIRNLFVDNVSPDFNLLKNDLTCYSLTLLQKEYLYRYPVYPDDFSLLLRYKLLSETKESLTKYMDINQDLANRIANYKNEFSGFTQFCELLKTKELTYSRISRCLIHILLDIRNHDSYNVTYARVLGFRKESDKLFSLLKNESSIPLLTKISNTHNWDTEVTDMLEQDIFASNLYECIISHKYDTSFKTEQVKQLVKI